MSNKKAIIIGAGPAGLTAAYELLHKTDIKPVIFEMTGDMGGISKTVNYKGNRIDIGGHRFFSKSDEVMNWWQNILQIETSDQKIASGFEIRYHNKSKLLQPNVNESDSRIVDRVMLIRRRISRIYYLRKFFEYPLSLNIKALRNLGACRAIKISISYFKATLFPIKKEKSLEDFFINRFGRELYKTFFKDYTEKVWGVSCNKIAPDWGAQRIKGLSITRVVSHAIKRIVQKNDGVAQKNVETSLIERFLYPKYGPGQMWEEVAKLVIEKGGEININSEVVGIKLNGNKICSIKSRDTVSGHECFHRADFFISSMPIRDLIAAIDSEVPSDVKSVAIGLIYRDFITVGLLLDKLKIRNDTDIETFNNLIPDNWIYIQESDVGM